MTGWTLAQMDLETFFVMSDLDLNIDNEGS